MAIIAEVSVDGHFPQSDPFRQAFREAVEAVADKARTAVPELNGRTEKAVQHVLRGDVSIAPDGQGKIASQSNGSVVYLVGKGDSCSCKDHPKAPKHLCKHVLAYHLYRRATALAREKLEAEYEATRPEAVSPESPVETPPTITIPQEFIVEVHGSLFVQYAGLLAMAHERGLVNLSAHFISVSNDLALAEATAEFTDGKVFSECADSTPQNVGPTVRAHFPRIALTRAKARCLRDALNIAVCSVEEMET